MLYETIRPIEQYANSRGQDSETRHKETLLLLLLLLFTAIEFSLGGSSPYTSTDETRINTHERNNKNHIINNTKHSKYKYTYYQNTICYMNC